MSFLRASSSPCGGRNRFGAGGWAGGVISVSIKKHFILLGSRGVNREPTELFLFPATLAPLAQVKVQLNPMSDF